MTEPLKVAVAGLGTVGATVVRLLSVQADLIAQRCGRPIVVTAVSARDRSKDRGLTLDGIAWFDDAAAMAEQADAHVVVEVIGGSSGIARAVADRSIAAGRHLVTANKALLALHGMDIARAADAAGVTVAYEAAVAGGIPVIKALKEGLAANRIDRVEGILNGTCNYILTTMRETGRDFADVLAEAQRLGYAEADPSFDIDGVDAAHKLALLAALAFGCAPDFPGVTVEGIRHVAADDIAYAEELGYRIKLLGIAERHPDGSIAQRVTPVLVPKSAPIAAVEGVFNAVVTQGDFVGQTVLEGRGAGDGPTASAVVADLMDIARGSVSAMFGVPVASLTAPGTRPMSAHRGEYYVRLMVLDKPGVFADLAAILRDCDISIGSAIQRARSDSAAVPLVLTTHETSEASMQKALATIAALPSVAEPPRMIRIDRGA